MAKTNLGLVAYAQSKLTQPTMYMLGGIGRMLTHAMVDARIAKGDRHTKANELIIRSGVGKAYAFDCNALMKGYLWESAPGVIHYNSAQDMGSTTLYNRSKVKGKMASMPDVPGLLVWTADLGHVGIYVGKENGVNQYIEATPAWNAWGVTTSADKNHPKGHNRTWAFWGEYHLIEYVKETPKPTLGLEAVAKEVIAGKWGNGADRVKRLTDAGYDAKAVQTKVNELLAKPKLKPVEEIAKEVIAGKWGNGTARVKALTEAGYNATDVQKKVNDLLRPAKKTIDEIAKEVILGRWGNGSDRTLRLTKAGYDAVLVQRRVNELLRKK